jgi:predicted ATPase
MLPEPGLVTFGSVADAIGAFRYHDATAMEAVASALHGRRALLVLDNVEQVVGGAGRFVVGLLARCRELAILATNREALHVSSEVVVVVPPLDVERDAPLLFRRQASTASPGIDLDAEHDNVLAICRELDGLPLALELAAARVATMSISDVRERLDRRFGLLRGERGQGRHTTLAGTIRWSYDLLEPHERRLFDRLLVFRGGFDVEGATTLLGAVRESHTEEPDVVGVLNSLADKSMLVRTDAAAGPRWEMLESLRHFGDNWAAGVERRCDGRACTPARRIRRVPRRISRIRLDTSTARCSSQRMRSSSFLPGRWILGTGIEQPRQRSNWLVQREVRLHRATLPTTMGWSRR